MQSVLRHTRVMQAIDLEILLLEPLTEFYEIEKPLKTGDVSRLMNKG